ncbi:zinc-binding alcohol dehydrogenase family protein [Microvirga makkahensis]|uniref:Zinc-type alcohol dehydrogenase-like protein n=1 Tax=Microvirga makkahensis TaxID=1128670 RepID=A0A7X3MWK8_9HYPH|nr:zinc-binding alcohol dehydrogenase family protein [Microvirga makkahensis]MXQ14572.1 zinc-binding alcohol dehydrogenase family protein [Microvirga makkahensis]
MRAVGYQQPQPIAAESSLIDIDLPRPVPQGRDVLVQIKAISVNPVDTKVRATAQPEDGGYKVLGWDAAGIVVASGPGASLFKPGDEVFYAGALNRPGTNAEYHLVDERIVGRKPASLDFSAAAALPLTALTAWETLFDRLEVRKRRVPSASYTILIIGGAGGVGSIAIQLARQLTDLTVVATASRPETRDWCRDLGAHHVIDHSKPLSEEFRALGLGDPGFVFATTNSVAHFPEMSALIAPQGHVAIIEAAGIPDVTLLKSKSAALHWEFMFTRSTYQTADMQRQHEILNEVSRLVDEGTIRTTLAEVLGPVNAANLKRAHAFIESGRAKGKIVLSGF